MQTATKEKTSPILAIGYSLGEVGSNISWYMINNYLTLFYTDVVGLTASAISLIMLIARVWDAVNDPMMGTIADRTNTKWGKFRPYLYMAPPVLAIFNILTFTVFPVAGLAKNILCLLCYVGAGMAYTAANIAYQALQNVCAIDSQVRMNLATAKGIGSSVIGILLSMFAMPMILAFSKGDTPNAHGYFMTTIVLSVVMVPAFWICATICKEKYTSVLHTENDQKLSFFQGLKIALKNSQLMCVVISTLLGAICVTGRMGLLTYYIIYVVGDYTAISLVFTTMTVCQLIGTLCLPYLTAKLSKKTTLIILQMVMNICFFLIFLNPRGGLAYLLVLSAICGITNSAANISFGLVGDSLEYGAWKLGVRQEGVAASMLSFGAKLATAFCGSVGVLLLSAVGYVPNAEQTAATQQGINMIVNLLPAFIGLLAVVPMLFYKLTPAKIAEIRADLDAGKHAGDR